MTPDIDPNEQLLTRTQLLDFLRGAGTPIGRSTLNKLCAPSAGQGPPVACWWGKRPLYRAREALAWRQALFTSAPSRIAA
jgi:hypothetical protein